MSSNYFNRITLCGEREQVTATIAFNSGDPELSEESSDEDSSDSDSDNITHAVENESCESDDDHIVSKCKRKKLMSSMSSLVRRIDRPDTTADKAQIVAKAPTSFAGVDVG